MTRPITEGWGFDREERAVLAVRIWVLAFQLVQHDGWTAEERHRLAEVQAVAEVVEARAEAAALAWASIAAAARLAQWRRAARWDLATALARAWDAVLVEADPAPDHAEDDPAPLAWAELPEALRLDALTEIALRELHHGEVPGLPLRCRIEAVGIGAGAVVSAEVAA